jgi:hypothetical protein
MQNLATLNLSQEQFALIDQALTQLEEQMSSLQAFTPADKARMVKLGDRSEAFCRQSLQMLADNPQIIPPNIDVADAVNDLQSRDRLLPRLNRLERLLQRGNDTAMALGGDAMSVAIQGYGLLKLVGRSEGLDVLRRDLGNRFSKSRRAGSEEMKAA